VEYTVGTWTIPTVTHFKTHKLETGGVVLPSRGREKKERKGQVVRSVSIAGSDSGGGAGIQADLKTFAALGVFGTSVVTAITAQNTKGVYGVHEIPPELIEDQFDAIWEDIGFDAIKIGMLGSERTISAVSKCLARLHEKETGHRTPVVLDPVLVAKGGHALLEPSAVNQLLMQMMSFVTVLTPNIPEALTLLQDIKHDKSILNRKVSTLADMKDLANELYNGLKDYKFKGALLVKGGHLNAPHNNTDIPAVDILLVSDEDEVVEVSTPWVDTSDTHGTGCTLSSAIAVGLARGEDIKDAVRHAKDYVYGAILHAPKGIGSGHGPLHHMWAVKPLVKFCDE